MSVLPTSAETAIDPNAIFSAIDFEGSQSIIVAVSGGSDSLALLYLLLEHRKSQVNFPKLIAVTVDHALRPGSLNEARYVGELCRKAGISHQIVQWQGPKPETGLSAKAREVRYGLLCDAAREAGADMIFTGHTLDDQVETFLMRSARSTADAGARGQAGMAAATLLEREIWLLRPLLAERREALRDYLRMIGIAWRDDPSNISRNYERVRVRQAVQESDHTQLRRDISERAAKRQRLNAEVAAILPGCATVIEQTLIEIDRERWTQIDRDVRQLAIGVLLALMGGQAFLPSADHCNKALDFMGNAGRSGKLALSRCIIEIKPTKILLYREMRSIPTTEIVSGQTVVWDGRYRVSNTGSALARIGPCGSLARDRRKEGGVLDENFHAGTAQSSPAIFLGDKIICVLDCGDHSKLPEGIVIARYFPLFDNILVGYDELLAQCVAKMFKVQVYKRSPVNQINKN